MSALKLAQKLWKNESLRQTVRELAVHGAKNEILPDAPPDLFAFQQDWFHLLRCASIFIASEDEQFGDIGLRIVQSAISFAPNQNERAFAAALLQKSAGGPALRVAYRKELVAPTVLSQLPFSLALDVHANVISSTINIGNDHEFVGNEFQNILWRSLVEHDWISASAPTSAGKSFILEKWIQRTVADRASSTIFFLVPTRALIAQVESDLRDLLQSSAAPVNISTLPLAAPIKAAHNVYVYTQERFHLYLQKDLPDLNVDLLIIDEAQQIGANRRGVLLQQVLELAAIRFPSAKVLFASPSTKNPEALLAFAPEGKRTIAITGSKPTVNQNLVWVSPIAGKPTDWTLDLMMDENRAPIGRLKLGDRPSIAQKLPFLAHAIGGDGGGNVIYVNRAADAEAAAEILCQLIDDEIDDAELEALAQYCEKAVHSRFMLRRFVRKGVAFHYGNIPQLIRTEVERLFSAGKIRFLVCTSTLVEGVNLSCRNIFLRHPKRGTKDLMAPDDFWNLAGRAGRWGKEFQGNIFCIDPEKEKEWIGGHAPKSKQKFRIEIATQRIVKEFPDFLAYVESGGKNAPSNRFYEYLFAYLVFRISQFGDVGTGGLFDALDPAQLERLQNELHALIDNLEVPLAIIHRNPGINPVAINDLYSYFCGKSPDDFNDLLPTDPLSDAPVENDEGDPHDAAIKNLIGIFTRISKYLNGPLGQGNNAYGNASLVVLWMRGYPLHRIIDRQIRYWRKRDPTKKDTAVIRETLENIEKIARFETPKYLQCYIDVLLFFLKERGREDLAEGIHDFWLYLEFGVSKRTQLSLMALGLSRSSVTAISDYLTDDSLDESACLEWLTTNPWDEFGLTALVETEIRLVLQRHHRQLPRPLATSE